jgi:hypothetical protein
MKKSTPNAANHTGRPHLSAWLLAMAWLLGACSSTQTPQALQLKPGARWQEVAKVAGESTGKFSYVMNGRKYDVVDFDNLSTSLIFVDSRLFASVSENGMAEWEHRLSDVMNEGDLPFENGLGTIHSWVLDQRKLSQFTPDKSGPTEPSAPATTIAEGVAGAVILAPISPILLAGGLVGGATYAMTGDDRRRAQEVNDSMVGGDKSYADFLSKFANPVMDTSKGSYRVREFYATQDSFFTSSDHFYDVATRNDKVQWVAYRSHAIRSKTYRYWSGHQAN